jgi:hypothetical protein
VACAQLQVDAAMSITSADLSDKTVSDDWSKDMFLMLTISTFLFSAGPFCQREDREI